MAGRLTGQKKRYDKESKQYLEVTKDATNLVHDQTIEHKTSPAQLPSRHQERRRGDGNPLVQIFGDKFTAGFGHFVKQVESCATY